MVAIGLGPYAGDSGLPHAAVTTEKDFLAFKAELSSTPEEIARRMLWTIAAPTLLIIGVAGNVVVLLVLLLTPSLRGRRGGSVGFALTALAVFDSVLLMIVLPQRYRQNANDVDISTTSVTVCQLYHLLPHLLTQLSSWTVALMSANRAVAIYRQTAVTGSTYHVDRERRHFIVSWVVAAVLLTILNMHFLWTIELVRSTDGDVTSARNPFSASLAPSAYGKSNRDEEATSASMLANFSSSGGSNRRGNATEWSYCIQGVGYTEFFATVWKWIDLVVWAALPFVVVLVANSFVAYRLYAADRRASKDSVDGSASASSSSTSADAGPTSRTSMALMIVAVGIAFLASNAPLFVYMAALPTGVDARDVSRYRLIQDVCKVVSLTGYATHLVVFCVGSRRFRRALSVLCGKK